MDTKQNIPEQRCGESCDLCNHPMDEVVHFSREERESILRFEREMEAARVRPKLLTAR